MVQSERRDAQHYGADEIIEKEKVAYESEGTDCRAYGHPHFVFQFESGGSVRNVEVEQQS
jgi:hypothetical protein